MSDEPKTLRISKLDAARRQLRTAITMWFNSGDPVSTHTLACAAYEIVHAVSKARDPNRPNLLFDSMHVKEDKRKEFNDIFRQAANFFKHGDRDPHGLLKFSPGLTEVFIYFAISGLQLCGESPIDEFHVFQMWLQISNPQLMTDAAQIEHSLNAIEHFAKLQMLPKHEFFNVSMRALRMTEV
jgi:hypothetical protein